MYIQNLKDSKMKEVSIMKKFIVLIMFFAVTLSFCSTANAKWIRVDNGKDKVYKAWYASDDIDVWSFYCTMWVKYILHTPKKAPNGMKYYICSELYAFPFDMNPDVGIGVINKRSCGIIKMKFYDANNNLVYVIDETANGVVYQDVPPGSWSEYFAELAAQICEIKFKNNN